MKRAGTIRQRPTLTAPLLDTGYTGSAVDDAMAKATSAEEPSK